MERSKLSPATANRQFPPFSFLPPNHDLTQPQFCKNSADYSLYSPQSPVVTPSSSISIEEFEDPTITKSRLYLAGLRHQYQDFTKRYELCLSHLQDASYEADVLRLENERLRISNGVLRERLVMGQDLQVSIADEFQKLRIKSSLPSATAVLESPTSVLEPRVALPKSISVRSTGYKKVNADGKVRISKPMTVGSQRVHIGGGSSTKKGSHEAGPTAATAALELEVYNQGMFKTELCNKWQESGQCPYGEHCQFAHGIGELRPVIRHPRYKTEVCRMVLAGDACPYGHRCHFRHALSPSEQASL